MLDLGQIWSHKRKVEIMSGGWVLQRSVTVTLLVVDTVWAARLYYQGDVRLLTALEPPSPSSLPVPAFVVFGLFRTTEVQ